MYEFNYIYLIQIHMYHYCPIEQFSEIFSLPVARLLLPVPQSVLDCFGVTISRSVRCCHIGAVAFLSRCVPCNLLHVRIKFIINTLKAIKISQLFEYCFPYFVTCRIECYDFAMTLQPNSALILEYPACEIFARIGRRN